MTVTGIDENNIVPSVASDGGKAIETNGIDEYGTLAQAVLSAEGYTLELLGEPNSVPGTDGPGMSVSDVSETNRFLYLLFHGTYDAPRAGFHNGTWNAMLGAALTSGQEFYAAFVSAASNDRELFQGDAAWRGSAVPARSSLGRVGLSGGRSSTRNRRCAAFPVADSAD